MDSLLNLKKYIVPAFFGLYLIIGLFVFDDYGVSWDEPIQRQHGQVSLDYIDKTFDNSATPRTEFELQTYDYRSYGTFYQLCCEGIESLLGVTTDRGAYLVRHFMVFFLTWIATIFFYLLASFRFKEWYYALLATLFLVVSPRLFANSFYNPKDSILLAFFIIGMYVLFRFLQKKTFGWAVGFALITAIVINARILGILVPLLAISMIVFEWIRAKNRSQYLKNHGAKFGVFFILSLIFTVLLWPFLWESPLSNFGYAFNSMKRYFWETDILYYGSLVKSTDLPWHYIPGWMLVTTPLLYIVFFFTGLYNVLRRWLKTVKESAIKIYKGDRQKIDLLLLGWFFIPLMIVIILNSTLYDGWRHMYYIYPAFIMITTIGIAHVVNWGQKKFSKKSSYKYLKPLFGAVLIGATFFTIGRMVAQHPHQNVYFNLLAGSGESLDKNFEQEYWGLSTREVLDHLVSLDKSESLKVFASNKPGMFNSLILKSEDRNRLNFVEFAEADYFIYHHRFAPAKKQFYEKVFPFENEIYTVKVNGITIAGLYDMRNKQ